MEASAQVDHELLARLEAIRSIELRGAERVRAGVNSRLLPAHGEGAGADGGLAHGLAERGGDNAGAGDDQAIARRVGRRHGEDVHNDEGWPGGIVGGVRVVLHAAVRIGLGVDGVPPRFGKAGMGEGQGSGEASG